jgi:hypothetical protein
MTRKIALALVSIALACKVEKTGRDTYKVVAPTPEAKKAAEKVKENTETAVQKLGDELKKVGEKAKTETKTISTEAKEETKEHTESTKTETHSKTKKH